MDDATPYGPWRPAPDLTDCAVCGHRVDRGDRIQTGPDGDVGECCGVLQPHFGNSITPRQDA